MELSCSVYGLDFGCVNVYAVCCEAFGCVSMASFGGPFVLIEEERAVGIEKKKQWIFAA